MMHERHARKLTITMLAAIAAMLVALPSSAVTRAEFTTALYGALGYADAPEKRLPPDVPISHPHAKSIGYAARWGLVPSDAPFMPDEEINRHQAVRLALQMMGWGFEVSLYDSLSSLPDFGGSGDSVFFLASEMKPQAPESLLIDGATPLSPTGRDSLIGWVESCKKFVRWNRVFAYEGTELSLFRQGVARPGETNAPGVEAQIGAAACEPLFVSALCVRPGEVDARIAFSEPLGRGRTVPSIMQAGYGAIAAVNGGYFYGARPLGSMLLNGTPAGSPIMGRGAIGWDNANGTIILGRGGARIGVRVGRAFAEVTKFNTAPPADEAALYTTDVTNVCVGIALDSLLITARGGRVIDVRPASGASFWLPEGSTTLVARGRLRELFAGASIGDEFEPISEWETQSFATCRDLIQGGPMLMMQGRFTQDVEGIAPDVANKRHPRTIVGTDGSRVIWAVVDGRSNIHSRGSTIEEAKWVARSLGMTSALNLDGGGSSQMIWRGVVTNSPSDGKERPLPYTVLFMRRGETLAWSPPEGDGEWGEWTGGSYADAGQSPVYEGALGASSVPTQAAPPTPSAQPSAPAAPSYAPGMRQTAPAWPMPPGSPADADSRFTTVYVPEEDTSDVDDEISALLERYLAPKSGDEEER